MHKKYVKDNKKNIHNFYQIKVRHQAQLGFDPEGQAGHHSGQGPPGEEEPPLGVDKGRHSGGVPVPNSSTAAGMAEDSSLRGKPLAFQEILSGQFFF